MQTTDALARPGAWRRAAVLIPIALYPAPSVLLTVRSGQLTVHAGQVALPGGRPQPGELCPVATALRETHEEVGIESDRIEVIGLLDRFETISGYRVVPVVGLINQPVILRPCPREVGAVFWMPWQRVADPVSYRRHRIVRDGRRYLTHSVAAEHWPVWGATASILHQLACRITSGASSEPVYPSP